MTHDNSQHRQEVLERARALAAHSGGTRDADTAADQQAWVDGTITHEELMDRVATRIRNWSTSNGDAHR